MPPGNQPPSGAESAVDTGLQCLLLISSLHGIAADPAQLCHIHGTEKFDVQKILLAARHLGLKAKCVRQNVARLAQAPLPAIAVGRDGGFFLLVQTDLTQDRSRILIQSPGEAPRVISLETLQSHWTGELIFFASRASIAGDLARFDFSWFIPALVKYRKTLGEILLISLVLQIIGLVTPLFFQVVMDKVLVNNAMKTLNVIALGLICATLFEAALSGVRSAALASTSSKIDVELGARLFWHVLRLPISYFHARRVGDSVARIRELENIRSFLTGGALTLVLDLLFSFVFIGVMLWYSPKLTLVVVLSIPCYVALSLIFMPMLRRRLNTKFQYGAENQSFLVETLSGMDTVKSMAVEPRWQQRWDRQLAAYVSASLSANNVAIVASGGVSLVSKLTSAAIMWMGALMVVDHQMTVGELIAFNMLAGQVSSPILRLAQLWDDFQQIGISMSRLGDVLNAHTEMESSKTRMPRLRGAVTFDNVSFRYRADGVDVIRNVKLQIRAGEVIGIVGRSGSGKSTLAKLVQRLYVPERGRVLVDGQDIAIVDTASLRQQIGVVQQENTLFSRSVRDNIALTDPALPLEKVMEAAQLAGAHEFICTLPEGYDTQVGEHGVGLSGGQRQRVAIARALISIPRILVFDEATSALDYESEKVIQDNMRQICAGRTVLIIAHRLSAVRDAHRIVVLDQGQVAELGTHAELLRREDGIYSHLFRLQSQGASAEAPTPGCVP